MSIQGEIERISHNISSAYNAVEEMGGLLPGKMSSDNLADAIHGIPSGGVSFTTNDTLTMSEDNVLGVALPVKAVTAAEYSALSEEEKMADVQWMITDDLESSGGSSGEIYSMEETRIGTWINGKPVYRICGYVANISGATADAWSKIADVPNNFEFLISITGSFEVNGNQKIFIPYGHVNGGIFYGIQGSSICVLTNSFFIKNATNFLYICEYTKTTDEAAIQIVPSPALQQANTGEAEAKALPVTATPVTASVI